MLPVSSQALPDKKQTVKSEAQRASVKYLLDYLTHVKLSHAISRNLQLINTMNLAQKQPAAAGGRVAKPEEFVRVYDILLQVRKGPPLLYQTMDCQYYGLPVVLGIPALRHSSLVTDINILQNA